MQHRPPTLIALVDDDQAVRSSLERLIDACGWTARGFDSAPSFLAIGLQPPCDCLLLDLYMPRMSGVALLHGLTARGIALPVIALTAHPSGPLAECARRAGARVVLPKPCAPARLIAEIRLVINAGAG